jgi:hypothetical protein
MGLRTLRLDTSAWAHSVHHYSPSQHADVNTPVYTEILYSLAAPTFMQLHQYCCIMIDKRSRIKLVRRTLGGLQHPRTAVQAFAPSTVPCSAIGAIHIKAVSSPHLNYYRFPLVKKKKVGSSRITGLNNISNRKHTSANHVDRSPFSAVFRSLWVPRF